jgi:hypothetical protein
VDQHIPRSGAHHDVWFPALHLQERGVGVTYSNMRLASTRLEWEWVGEVHEYVHRKDGKWVPQQTIEGLWFNHDATGGQGGKRFVRDEAILLKVGPPLYIITGPHPCTDRC